ncbi:bifunctional riboflavin kinase/FAD synthetase [Fictibacillus terranigra]|uniref:Riboflavin biosynthesis protein n=1 Tax=Fictibacillus terranigra TaxID=3058424 RepID=A0ABT8E650_9BACL|nr:bifunctional riboflavin kinase/FAD synthetase [Fictibacillus sp. CENA-BCM004]MDN4073394.1 bifunctional riboflavin kinase/FAD synthetase [Fictibacillus sp. CENA-BCM004]
MKTITLSHPHQLKKNELPPTVMALGYFDGIHKGHQKVIGTAAKIAREQKAVSAVMSFHPHPSVVLGKKEAHVSYLTPLEKKEVLLREMGIDIFYLVEFNEEFASLAPLTFIQEYLTGLNVRHVVAGFDYTYGKFGKGNMAKMNEYAKGEFSQTVIEKMDIHGQKISSTLIRNLLKEGDVDQIPEYLGRPYSITGVVIHGESRGTSIGFPTANISSNDDYLIPANGVYIVQVEIGDTVYNGVANIGKKPTFHEDREASIEVHLFDFSSNIYGKTVEVYWLSRIRDEKKFDSVDSLVKQISADKQAALDFFYEK